MNYTKTPNIMIPTHVFLLIVVIKRLDPTDLYTIVNDIKFILRGSEELKNSQSLRHKLASVRVREYLQSNIIIEKER
ncbi:4815_t:CDS:2, partial [Dentiscutata erythropus]